MAELLVRVVDKVNSDPYLDVHCTKRGDVIAVCPDGWRWGSGELNNPAWRIVKLPGVTVSQASVFLGPEIETDPTHPNRMRRNRAFKIDVDALGDMPAGPRLHRRDKTLGEMMALKVAKVPLADPNVFA